MRTIQHLLIRYACMAMMLAFGFTASAQDQKPSVTRQVLEHINSYGQYRSIEKLYLQTDRTEYNINDTLWFKGYLLNAALNASAKSGLLYVEIADAYGQVVKRNMVSVYAGLAWGNIALNTETFPQGTYTLRAYTNWMRNYDEHYTFTKQFVVTNTNGAESWLISTRLTPIQQDGKPAVRAGLDFRNLQQQAIAARDVEVALTEGRKTWFKNKMMIGVDGVLDLNFQLPEKADPKKLSVRVKELKKDKDGAEYLLPVILNRKDHTDLQFMPEGGTLVAGLKSKVAFKAIGEDGNSVNISGKIVNSKQQQVVAFHSTHRGMGDVELMPQPGETYTAVIQTDSGRTRSYPLPSIKPSGIVLSVSNLLNSDSLSVSVTATPDMIAAGNMYYLVAQCRGIANYGAPFRLEANGKQFHIDKNIFPTGITRFTLLDNHMQPVNERIVFVDHHDRLCINIATDKKSYGKRDSVAVNISVTDKGGAPVQGVFSMAVTDDNQASTNALTSPSLVGTMLLGSELKGQIEDPGYYLQSTLTDQTMRDLDDLLLSQGWVNYDWSKVFFEYRPEPAFAAERSFSVQGKVTNIFNKPVANSGVMLLAKKPALLLDTVTNAAGIFTFNNIYPADTAAYVIQARNKRGKSFNVGIDMIEFVPPVFAPDGRRNIPSYMNLDSSKTSAVHNRIAYKLKQDELMGMHMIKEVVIKDKKIIKESKNLNGPGGSDFALNEADIEKAGKMSMGDLLRKNIKGFYDNGWAYKVNGTLVMLVIDGIFVPKFHDGAKNYKELYDRSFNYYTAEDVKGVELMKPGQYGFKYFNEFMNPLDDYTKYTFIEITTRAGKGPFYSKTPGVYVYRPNSFIIPQEFYSPRYITKDKTLVTDIRSTIYWKPNVVTDKDGKATISFYTADMPGTYTILMEGVDLNGGLETTRSKITVR